MVFEGVPGGPMDCWGDVTTPAGAPREAASGSSRRSCRGRPSAAASVELTDANGILAGRFAPTVRKPVGELPSGALVLGLADAVVLNDPITGQGSNNAREGRRLVSRRASSSTATAPFDRAFMEQTFERVLEDYGAVRRPTWTNALLAPPPPHVLEAARRRQRAARRSPHRFVNGFDDPRDYFEWFMDPDKASSYLASV